MMCDAGHGISSKPKREGKYFFSTKHTCDRCEIDIGPGGEYYKCSAKCDYHVCARCYAEKWYNFKYLPCYEPFPSGLGPFSVRRTRLAPGDVRTLHLPGSDQSFLEGGSALLCESFFSRSENLLQLWQKVLDSGVALDCPEDKNVVGSPAGLGLREGASQGDSFYSAIPPSLCTSLPSKGDSPYPAIPPSLPSLPSQGDSAYPGRMPSGKAQTAATATAAKGFVVQFSPSHPVNLPDDICNEMEIPAGREGSRFAWMYPVRVAWQDLLSGIDVDSADVALLTVGGYIYFKQPSDDSAELELLCAYSIAFHPNGSLAFSTPRPWPAAWTDQLTAAGRFQPVTTKKWAASGARHICWIRPNEPLPSPFDGECRPIARYGGFAFLFHELDEVDKNERDRYFEIVSASSDRLVVQKSGQAFALIQAPADHEAKLQRRLFALAAEGRWLLIRHLLVETPDLAEAADDVGQTILHKCALLKCNDPEFLENLHRFGTPYDTKDQKGKTATDLGDLAFRRVVRQIWNLLPNLFFETEIWFEHWDADHNGVLDASELAPALAAAYGVDDVGRQWIQSYVTLHYQELAPSGVFTKEGFGGLVDHLQASDEFIRLRDQHGQSSKMPALFRSPKNKKNWKDMSNEARQAAISVESELRAMRLNAGWEPGKPFPNSTKKISVSAPFAGGDSDPSVRLIAAREMLGWSFAQMSSLQGEDWVRGFRLSFIGNEGIDEGGLTAAWILEIAFALWYDESFFDSKSTGFFFKPDKVCRIDLNSGPVEATAFYKWCGRFVAYALYHRCCMDCRLSPWVFRYLSRFALGDLKISEMWEETTDREDHMLEALASLDPAFANSLWRVRYEMPDDELQWLDFTVGGDELKPGGSDIDVNSENKAEYVRLCCQALLCLKSKCALENFCHGFFDVLPRSVVSGWLRNGLEPDGIRWLLAGNIEVSDAQLDALEQNIVPDGLVPWKLRNDPAVKRSATWVFKIARANDGAFRSRLLEFWTGCPRLPLAGASAITPRPRLQVMVQADGSGIKPIGSWPSSRFPEGHTCGNELWIPLCNSEEQLAALLVRAVNNFEKGFALA